MNCYENWLESIFFKKLVNSRNQKSTNSELIEIDIFCKIISFENWIETIFMKLDRLW